jgi:hypothetical protein
MIVLTQRGIVEIDIGIGIDARQEGGVVELLAFLLQTRRHRADALQSLASIAEGVCLGRTEGGRAGANRGGDGRLLNRDVARAEDFHHQRAPSGGRAAPCPRRCRRRERRLARRGFLPQ